MISFVKFFILINITNKVVVYNPSDGTIISKHTAQGFADNSSWGRGQSWGLYGYTVCLFYFIYLFFFDYVKR
jgi:hypothetical protein